MTDHPAKSKHYDNGRGESVEESAVMVPALALSLLQASMSSTQAVTDSLALMAWEQARDTAHEAVQFFLSVEKATEVVTTRRIERIFDVTPINLWIQRRNHASEMVRKMGGKERVEWT